MPNPLGYSFAPSFDNAEQGRRGGSPATSAQDPLQVLSFRLPKFKGAAGGLSPLQGTVSAGGIGNAVLQSVLQTVLGAQAGTFMDAIGAPASATAGREIVPGQSPDAIDTGLVGAGVRGPSNPSPFQTPKRDPAPDVTRPPDIGPPVVSPGINDPHHPGRAPGGGGGERELPYAPDEPLSFDDPALSTLGAPSFGTEPTSSDDWWANYLQQMHGYMGGGNGMGGLG